MAAVREVETIPAGRLAFVERRYGAEPCAGFGPRRKEIMPVEAELYPCDKRSIHAIRAIAAGERLTAKPSDLRSERNLAPGLHPRYWDVVLGARTTRPLSEGEGLGWSHLLVRESAMIPLVRSTITERDLRYFQRRLSEGLLDDESEVQRFEDRFAATIGAGGAVAVNSGTSGLFLALKAPWGWGRGRGNSPKLHVRRVVARRHSLRRGAGLGRYSIGRATGGFQPRPGQRCAIRSLLGPVQ